MFLIDGFGALLSAFLLGIVLTRYESTFGMPRQALYFLAILPCLFAVYDFICYFRTKENRGSFLKAIGIANLLYCCISIGFVLHHFQKLTILGLLYFMGEILIVTVLASVEIKTANELAKESN